MITIEQAQNLIAATAKNFGVEEVPLHDGFNRTLATCIYADRDYPPFNRSAMDGYAVQTSDFKNSNQSVTLTQIETVFAGQLATSKLISGTCIKIMTGAPLPDGADAVIRIEDTFAEKENITFKTTGPVPFLNIAKRGEDSLKGKLLLEPGHLLDMASMSLLATTGHALVKVFCLPKVLVIATGSELVPVGAPVLPFQIRDSNSITILNFLKQQHITAARTLLIKDDKIALKAGLEQGLNHDIIVLSGGVSKGDADYIPEVLAGLGVQEIFHRVKIKPGSPLWFGTTKHGGVVFGLPGNPVAVQVSCKLFIEPYLRKCFQRPNLEPVYFPLLEYKKKKTGLDEYFPCRLYTANKRTGLKTNRMNGSGDIKALSGSDGIALYPGDAADLQENESVAFYSWK
jgi:molybdopterin molybdotransferase